MADDRGPPRIEKVIEPHELAAKTGYTRPHTVRLLVSAAQERPRLIDYLVFSRPWLDGPTALASTIEASADMTIATTVALPVVRGPAQTAKTLAAIDILSGGRLIAGVGPGSSPRDYAAIGVPFEERWKRFDEAIRAVRSLLREAAEGFAGTFYSTEGLAFEPLPRTREGATDLDRKLGFARRPAPRRAPRRRLAGLRYNTTPPNFERGLPSCQRSSGRRERARRHFPTASSRCGST